MRAQVDERLVDDPLGLGRRRELVEDVAADERQVDRLVARDLDDLVEHRGDLVEPLAAVERLADVPVGGVQDPHRSNLANGSPPDSRRHLARPGRPRREREADLQRHRDLRLRRASSTPA